MSDHINLPKPKTHKSPKATREEFARWVVNKQIADQLPADGPSKMLDLVIALRHTRQLYQEQADMLSQITVDPDKYEEYLAPDVLATLTNNTRAIVRQLIISNANSINKNLVRMLAVLDEAMSQIDESSTEFVERMDERIFSYGNEAANQN